jgi:hypothetical protein
MKLIRGGVVVTLAMSLFARAQAGVLPNDAVVSGKTIGEWSADWLKWMVVIPTNQNPMLDPDGSSAAVGQPDGSVFFLGFVPGFTPGTVTRRFSVPEGKYLFLPVMFYEADNVNTFPLLSVEELRDQAAGIVDNPIELHASIDGIEVPNLLEHRAISPVFSFFYEIADNFHTWAFNGQPITGVVDPVIADGYWLMVEPLPPGVHTIHYGGTLRNATFVPSDIIAHISVAPTPLSEQVSALIDRVGSSVFLRKDRQSLLSSLQAARASFEATHRAAGLNQLQAFQNKVRAEVRRSDQTLADDLTEAAQQIIDRATRELE